MGIQYISSKHDKSIAAEFNTISYEGKGEEFEEANAIGDTEIFEPWFR